MYATTPSLLAALDNRNSLDSHLNELRLLEESTLLLEKKGTFKNLLSDAGQAALSSGAIAATGGAGGDVVVDVIFAAKIAGDVIEEVTSILQGAGEIGDIIMGAARLDFDGSEAFEKKVQSLIRKTVKNRFVGDKAKEMIEAASEKVNEILEKIARAVGKWVGALIPDDFGLGGPAFEALFQQALQAAGKNSYAIAMAGIKALPFNAGNYLVDRNALEDLLETIATKMIEFIDDATEWAETARAELDDEGFGGSVKRRLTGAGMKLQALSTAMSGDLKQGFQTFKDAELLQSKSEFLYLTEKALPAVKDFLVKFRDDWIPTTVTVIRKLMSYLMAAVVIFQELIDPEDYLKMKTKKGSDFESLNPLAGQGPIDLGLKEDVIREAVRQIILDTMEGSINEDDLDEDVRKRGNEWCAYVDDKLTKAEKENNPKKYKGKKVGSVQRTKSGKIRMKARACYRSKKKANNAMAAAMMG